jgi:hypothetical protein
MIRWCHEETMGKPWENGDLTSKNGDLTSKNGDLTIKNDDLTSKNGIF